MIKAEVIILAGGLATRLKNLTKKKPKSLIDINGKPFIERQLDLLKDQGIKKVIISIGHYGEQIKKYLKKNYKKKIKIKFVKDTPFLLGTGGAIVNSSKFLKKNFFVIYGDSYLRFNLKTMRNFYLRKKPKILMAIYKNNKKLDKSNLQINKKGYVYYNKRNVKENMKYIDYGVSIINLSILKNLKKKKYYDLGDIFTYYSLRNDIMGMVVKNRFFEIGSKKCINDTRKYFKNLKKKNEKFHN